MNKAIAAAAAALSFAGGPASASPAAGEVSGQYGKYESPVYTVEQELAGAEIRLYAPQIVAIVSVDGDRRGALNRGFRVLANYIFGGNEAGASIAMTSPVTQAAPDAAGEPWTVTFMVPRAWSMETLPRPRNAAVRFEESPARRMLALTFSGRTTAQALDRRTRELREIADRNGLSLAGPPEYLYYDDPFTLPWQRRNEVAFPLD